MKAIRIHQYGSPEVLKYADVAVAEPKAADERGTIEAIGLNFIDIHQRTGRYPLQTPATLGMEGAGVVNAFGDAVTEVQVGERVAYTMILGSMLSAPSCRRQQLPSLPSEKAFSFPMWGFCQIATNSTPSKPIGRSTHRLKGHRFPIVD